MRPADELITIKTFTYAHEASIAESLLRAEGIFCFLKDALTIQANPFYSNALGGVKLQVHPQDVDSATRILREGDAAHDSTEPIIIRNADGAIAECPACESSDISVVKKPSRLGLGLGMLLLGFPVPLFSSVYHCWNCGRDIRVSKA